MNKVGDIGAGILERLASAQAKQKEQQRQEAEEKERQRAYNEANNLVQLPLWPESMRGVPNSVLRGSLFAAIPERCVIYCDDIILHESEKLTIKYTGKRLTQSDLNVWEYALHLARTQCLGNKIYFTERSFLHALGKTDGVKNYRWLDKVFKKLRACAVAITHNGFTYMGGLVNASYRDDKEGKCVLVIDPKIARLFEAGNTWISWEERKLIGKRKPLAQYLHGIISTHAEWMPHKVETIKVLSGSETKELKRFRKALKDALAYLRNLELIEEFRIDEKDLVYIKRKPSKAQQKYLDSKSK